MKALLYILFIFFGCRGLLENLNIIPSSIMFLLNLILKDVFIIWFFLDLFIKRRKILASKFFALFCIVFLLSSIFNVIYGERFIRSIVNIFYPISVFYFIIYFLKIKDVYRFLNFSIVYLFIQIIYSFIANIPIFMSGKLLIDDYFFGFFGFPRAYHFSYVTAIVSFFFLAEFIKTKIIKFLVLFLLFCSVQFLAGAGRLVLVYIPVLFLGFSLMIKFKIQNIIFFVLVVSLSFITLNYYSQNMKNFDDGISVFKEESFMKNPKIIYLIESFEPIVENKITFVFGKGPGNYMSWTGQYFNPELEKKFNSNLHGLYSTDAYQAFNNLIGFFGEFGFFGFIFFYLFVLSFLYYFRRFKSYNKENYAVLFMIVLFSVLFSTLVHVFDDAYYSLSFWLYLAIIIRILVHDSSKNIPVKTEQIL